MAAMFEIGVMLNNLERDRHRAWQLVARLGFRVVDTNALPETWMLASRERQLPEQDRHPALVEYTTLAQASGLSIHTMFIGFDGQSFADPASAARTVGLGVPALRPHRLQIALAYCGLAGELNAHAVGLHAGRVPGEGDSPDLIRALRELADHAAANGLGLHLETGQEPAECLRQL